jgi:microcystin-dependent protein
MPDLANYITEMDISLPLANASAGEGDDEIRAVKRAVKGTFPGDPAGTYNLVGGVATADPYTTGVIVGPRYLNSIPTKIAAIDASFVDVDDRITALEAPAGVLVIGMILMWAGAFSSIPTGWKLCDGTSGTVNLQNKFVLAAGATYPVTTTGGAASVSTDTSGSHTHTVTVTGTALTVGQMPLHGHPWSHKDGGTEGTTQSSAAGGIVTGAGVSSTTVSAYTGAVSTTSGQQIGGAGAGETHTHIASTAATGSPHAHSVATLPPYYAIYYIQFTGIPVPP